MSLALCYTSPREDTMIIKWSLIALLGSVLVTAIAFKANLVDLAAAFYVVAWCAGIILLFAIPYFFAAKVFRWLRRP